jgi:hypothetical protein
MSYRHALTPLVGAVALVLTASAATPAIKGPPWISIEYPANPWDGTTRGAFLLVHAFHHGTPVDFPVSGTAEGIVDGQRKTVSLEFVRTSRPGVYSLKRQWDTKGVWTLVISVTQQQNDIAQALVELDPKGAVASVRVPTQTHREGEFPRKATSAEIEATLKR